ncbi:hypothetical protein VRRI112168_02480 [Vreelandella rituensis]|uniref:Uncharacterized protein n=1 Tax=Vreelandella rituensis TaxID=2282306 RepID=A0A368U941_9GAMM|nr:hypothetical protein [Halomonas rituensis]RCV93610.1 hypothetical protein DU506_00200 [Halomonas rituensis]
MIPAMNITHANANPAAEKGLLYKGNVKDWYVDAQLLEASNAQEREQIEAGDDALPYDIQVHKLGEQLFITMTRFGLEVACLSVEVDKGVPTVHLGDRYDMGAHLHFAHGGIVITPDSKDEALEPAPKDRYSYEDANARLLPMHGNASLEVQRRQVFDELFENYDFGWEIEASGAAFHTENEWCMRVVAVTDADKATLTFKVRFVEGTTIPCMVDALDMADGTQVGNPG